MGKGAELPCPLRGHHTSEIDTFTSPEAFLKFLVDLYVGFGTETKLIGPSVICDWTWPSALPLSPVIQPSNHNIFSSWQLPLEVLPKSCLINIRYLDYSYRLKISEVFQNFWSFSVSEMGRLYIYIPYYKLQCHNDSRQKHSRDIYKVFRLFPQLMSSSYLRSLTRQEWFSYVPSYNLSEWKAFLPFKIYCLNRR